MDDSPPKPTWLERVGALLMREPEDRDQLVELLRSAYEIAICSTATRCR